MSAPAPFDATAPLPRGTTVLEASAGTGKTYTITSLVVRLVAAEDVPLDRILVVTFTEAATAELRDRIRARLVAARDAFRRRSAKGDPLLASLLDDEEVVRAAPARLDAALSGFDEATIATIHGFCHRVLSEQAFESGVTYDTELLTDLRPLLADVLQDVWTEETVDATPEWLETLSGMDARGLESFAQLVCRAGDARLAPDAPDGLEEAWRGVVRAVRDLGAEEHAAAVAMLRAVPESGGWRAAPSRDAAARIAALETWLARAEPPPFDAPAALSTFTEETILATVNKRWAKKNPVPSHPLFARLGELAALQRDGVVEFRRRLAGRLRERLDERKASRGVWSFDDLLVRLRDALGGDGGEALKESLRRRFRAVLIDEFQDTDAVQWEIFRRAFGEADGWLCLIGDPKQAIYRFRGADIETYFRARDGAARRATLLRNWRSDPRCVRAVNAVFERPPDAVSPLLDGRIAFAPVEAEKDDRIAFDGAPGPALRLLVRETNDKPWNKGEFEADLPARVASEVVRLLNDGTVTITPEPDADGAPRPAEPLRPRHLAALTRTNRQARDVQAELLRRKVPSILHGDASVFSTREATDLLRILEAVLDPSRETTVKGALATDLLGEDAAAIDRLANEGDADWVELLDGLRDDRRRWEEHGLVAMLQQLFQSRGVVARALAVVGGERAMTNVVHLVELLHRAAREERLGPAALVRWLTRQIDRESDGGYTDREAAQIRLESDAAAVQIATVHRAKGLEYPVVFLPFLWKGRQAPRDWFLEVRDDQGNRVIDLRGAADEDARAEAHREDRREELRLTYVALTRARHLTVVHHGLVKEVELSPLGHLLHGGETVDDAALRRDLAALAARSDGTIEVADDREPSRAKYQGPDSDASSLDAASLGRTLDRLFRTSSFSALVSGHAGPAGSPTETGAEQDDPALEPASDGAAGEELVPLHDFVRGTRAGRFLHRVLEVADFRPAARDALAATVADTRRYFGIPAAFPSAAVADALGCALDAPLDDAGTRLADVPPARRWNELPFLFPVAPGGAPVRPRDLAAVIRREGPPAVPVEVAERIEALDFLPLAGFLRGYIDLVFADAAGDDARFWVVDFKSNDLGPRYGDYRSPALRRAMREHDYDLQALLYLVAVHRFLRVRLAGYDPARHLGGARYLFLRGMSPDHPRRGVVEIPASPALVLGLDAVLAGPAAASKGGGS